MGRAPAGSRGEMPFLPAAKLFGRNEGRRNAEPNRF